MSHIAYLRLGFVSLILIGLLQLFEIPDLTRNIIYAVLIGCSILFFTFSFQKLAEQKKNKS